MEYNNDLNEIIKYISGSDIYKLATPIKKDLDKIFQSGGIQETIKFAQDMKKAMPAKLTLTGLSADLLQIAKEYNKLFKPQIEAYQSIQMAIQPLIFQQTKFQDQFAKIKATLSPSLSIIETITSYNSFTKYQESFKEFGGTLNLENYTEEDIQTTIEENRIIINEVNEAIVAVELQGLPHINFSELIFNQLRKIAPNLNPKSFAILVLILIITFNSYEFYLHYSTEETIKEKVVPTLENHTKSLNDISTEVYKINTVITEDNNQLNEMKKTEEANSDKLDTLIEEIRKIKFLKNDSKSE